MSFDLADYVDVAERIRIFREKHPDGSLQSEVTLVQNGDGFLMGVLCKATAYRTPDDPIPGNGHSYLGVPGKTPYTKDSEVENAETSAWGRAIVAALAADTKKVASADEVRSKIPSEGAGGGASASGSKPESAPTSGTPAFTPPEGTASQTPAWTWPFGKFKGKTLADTERGYLDWFLEKSDKEDIKQLVREHLNLGDLEQFADQVVDEDIPF